MTAALLLVIAAAVALAAAALYWMQQAREYKSARLALAQWEADLKRRERNVADRADRWIAERGAWAAELESAKAAAARADYWQRRAGELKQKLQEVQP